MKTPTQLLFGGMGDDYSVLKTRAAADQSVDWVVLKNTRKGDRLLVYFNEPHSAILATAIAQTDAREEASGYFRGRMHQIEWLAEPISFSELRHLFPAWEWLKYPRSKLYINEEMAAILWKRAGGQSAPSFRRWRNQGAGFGDPETNRLVEKAAVRRVTRELKAKGYAVVSREKDREGYDLDATRKGKTLHVEVKGIAGSELAFGITWGEMNRAKEDAAFRLHAVTDARETALAKTHRFTGAQLLARFKSEPIAYRLTEK